MPNNTFSFYFNYDYGRTPNKTIDKESSVKHIVDIFYKQYFGKIINVTDMKSECGSFFIITFNKDTWNWGNSIAYRLYNTGFENNETLRHKMINEYPITFTNPNGDEWQIFLTTFPNFTAQYIIILILIVNLYSKCNMSLLNNYFYKKCSLNKM